MRPLFILLLLLYAFPKKVFADEEKLKSVADLTTRLGSRLVELDRVSGPLDCRDAKNVYQRLQRALNRNAKESCLAIVDQCDKENPSLLDASPFIALRAGDCVKKSYDRKRTQAFYERARYQRHAEKAEYPYILVHTAYESLDEITPSILSNFATYKSWDDNDRKQLLALVSREYSHSEELEKFVRKELKNEKLNPTFRAELYRYFLAQEVGILHLQEAIDFAHDFRSLIDESPNPYRIAVALYFAIYADESLPLTAARKLYDKMLPFASPSSWLPTESNTYTYTELYEDVCPEHLLPEERRAELLQLADSWQAGEISAEEALAGLSNLQIVYPEQADVLTLRGSIQLGLKDLDEATASFWKAHLACPYYNKAHRGLSEIAMRRDWAARREQERDGLLKESSPLAGGSDLAPYIVGFAGLGSLERLLLKQKLKLWIPYLPLMAQKDSKLYLLTPDRLVSQVPGLRYNRDRRVSYRRLLDDVSGYAGVGTFAIVDTGVLFQDSLNGTRNTIAHEMAHRFEMSADLNCIGKLFAQAKERNIFLGAYSERMGSEYFAVGAEHYAERNERLRKLDPDLYNFLASIEAANGDLQKIKCPL